MWVPRPFAKRRRDYGSREDGADEFAERLPTLCSPAAAQKDGAPAFCFRKTFVFLRVLRGESLTFQFSRSSSAFTIVFSTFTRAKYLLLASTTVHGAPGVLLWSSMSST